MGDSSQMITEELEKQAQVQLLTLTLSFSYTREVVSSI